MSDQLNEPEPTERSIVLVDWARNDEPTARSRELLLYELMVLSLLYDEVLVQDEIFLCSRKMARWFRGPENFRLLEELLAIGGIVVLKRPVEKYPSELQELAQKQPVIARREHLERFSVGRHGEPIRFDGKQAEFHARLASVLAISPHAHRPAGSKKPGSTDLIQRFGTTLKSVLTEEIYLRWRSSRFPQVTPSMAKDFVRFVEEPNAAIHLVRSSGQEPKYTPDGKTPVFNTALATQAAATYPPSQADTMIGLIETVFAVPYCEDEFAEGRYGPALRELPLAQATQEEGTEPASVKVETKIQIPMGLPRPAPGFAQIIQGVRDSIEGRTLRNAMNQLGADLTFRRAEEAWAAVADKIACKIATSAKTHKIDVLAILASVGKHLFFEFLAEFSYDPVRSVHQAASWLPLNLSGEGLSLGGGYLYRLICEDLRRQRISDKLANAVPFRCVKIPTLGSEKPGRQIRSATK